MAEGGPLAGGNSAAKTPMGTDDEIYSVLTESIRAELGAGELAVHSYTTQVVAGTRYQIKIRAGNGTFWHFSVIKPLPHTGDPPFIQPDSLVKNKTESDPL